MKIGIFDSGLGGLTAVRELEIRSPKAGYIYFGDTARVPYGTRGKDVICRYAIQDSRFLLSKNVDAIMIACCTVSANCIPILEDTFDIPFFGVVEPAVTAAVVSAASKINKSRFRKKHPLPWTSYALGRGGIHVRFTVRRGGTCSPSPDRTACCPAPWDSRCTGRPPAPAVPPQAPGTRYKSPAGLPPPAAPPEWRR